MRYIMQFLLISFFFKILIIVTLKTNEIMNK